MRTKFYHLWGKATSLDGSVHYVTIVGKLEQGKKLKELKELVPIEIKPGVFVNGEIKFEKKEFNRKLTLGLAICHPTDRFDEEVGCEVAKARIERGEDLGSLETSSVTMLTEDAIMGEILIKLDYVTNHIDDYLPE